MVNKNMWSERIKNQPESTISDYGRIFRSIIDKVPKNLGIEGLDKEKLAEQKRVLLEKHNNNIQEIEFIYGIIEHLWAQNELNKEKAKQIPDEKEIKRIKLELTEFFYFQTHHIIENQNDEKYITKLFSAAESLANRLNQIKQWKSIKQGLIGQVGLFDYLEKKNFSPVLSHPKEDAWRHIDMWATDEKGEKLAVQGKHSSFANMVKFFRLKDELIQWIEEIKMKLNSNNDQISIGQFTSYADKLISNWDDMEKYCIETENINPAVIVLPKGSINEVGKIRDKFL